MPISVTDLGFAVNGSSSGTGTGVVYFAPGPPAGSLIVALTNENVISQSSGGSVVDSPGNTYTSIISRANNQGGGLNSAGPAQVWYSWNSLALPSSEGIGEIFYTNQTAGSQVAIAAFYATGINTSSDPLDTNVTAASVGNSSNPSVTSGAPSIAGELFVGGLTWIGSSGTSFTQSAGFATPFDTTAGSSVNAYVAGGNLVNVAATTKSYAPSLSASQEWADFIVAFKASPASQNMAWFMPLAEQVDKARPGLKTTAQQSAAFPPPQPVTLYTAATAMPLFEWRMQYQALSTVIPKMLPTPSIVGVMNLKELKDAFLGGAMIFNAPNGGEIGISERLASQVGEIGVSERPTPGNAAITGGGIGVTQR